jgi:DNA-binding Lrp family transcriptional regulator
VTRRELGDQVHLELDDADLALLGALRKDGRASFERLGSLVGLSRTAARARVHRMLATGTVSVEAIAHPAVSGHTTFAHLSVLVAGVASRSAAEAIAAFDNAPFVSVVAGRCSLIAELRTRDIGEMEASIARVRGVPGVIRIDTVLYTDVVKDSHMPLGGPHTFRQFDLDELDRTLLSLLQADARMPYADLAEVVGLSRNATRTRVLRLLNDGVVVVKGLVSPTAVGINQMCGFQVHLSGDADHVVPLIAKLDEVDFLARTIGRGDVIGTMIARGRDDITAALDELRLLDGVRSVEAWWHLELVKERYVPQVTRV